jgi:hypothetical protein
MYNSCILNLCGLLKSWVSFSFFYFQQFCLLNIMKYLNWLWISESCQMINGRKIQRQICIDFGHSNSSTSPSQNFIQNEKKCYSSEPVYS